MSLERGLAPQGRAAAPGGPADEARARVRGLLDEVMRLDAEVEELSRALEAFARAYEREAGPALSELARAEALVRRLQGIQDEIVRLAAELAGGPRAARRPRGSRIARGAAAREAGAPGRPEPGDEEAGEPEPAPEPEVLPEEVALKRLWRRLARILHPDLASGDADRARLSDLMARVNAAYEAGDLAALELMAERVGAGEDPEAPSGEALVLHLERRAAALAAVRESLVRERERLLATDTARLRAEAGRRREAGGDLLAESREAALADAAAAREDALLRLSRLFDSARELARRWRNAMDRLSRRGPTGALRPFDPVAESPLVRRGARLAEARRAGPAARELARRLEELALSEPPWEAALTLLAFLSEAAGTPPESLASAGGLAAAWEQAAAGWEAPDLARALARLPRHLALGMRVEGRELPFGIHLAAPELAAGVRLALGSERVREVARRVLASLGPELRCRRCRKARRAVHLLRIRGPDEVHGLACPACGEILRSYWRYGEPGGLEGLAPLAVEVGLVSEMALRFAGATVALQLLPAERARLTGGALRRRLADLLFAPYRIDIGPGRLRILAGRREVGPREQVPGGRLAATLGGGGMTDAEALELVRSRVERRFRE
jgi:curved DNA-binding protein CbpA